MLSIYRLPGKMPDEKIIKVLRRDLMILFMKVIFVSILAGTPILFFYILRVDSQAWFNDIIIYPLIILGSSAYYLFIWLLFFFFFLDYYLDVWIVTSKRIINIEQNGFFSRTISEQMLDKVQDVTSEVEGVIPTLFNYGDLHVQTAGERVRFVFEQIPNPSKTRDLIIHLTEQYKDKPNE